MPATEVFEQHLFRLDCSGAQGSAEHEEAYMSYVKLLYRHASAGRGFKPGQLRDVLERAISEFPSNTLFLSVFYHNERELRWSALTSRADLLVALCSPIQDPRSSAKDARGRCAQEGCHE